MKGPDKIIPSNPLWPLPEDYYELGQEARRLARVNACRQYLRTDVDVQTQASIFARCVAWFDRYYLKPDEHGIRGVYEGAIPGAWPDHAAGHVSPLFYDSLVVNDPPFLLDMHRWYWLAQSMILVCPRGSSKSVNIRRRTLLRALAEPGYTQMYMTSTDNNAKHSGKIVHAQFRANDRLLRDWTPEFDGRLVPRRGEGSYSLKDMTLRNGSQLAFGSVNSLQRGMRPLTYELDDPEADAKGSTSMAERRMIMDKTLFNVVLPMMNRPMTRTVWTATFISRQHFAWHAFTLKELRDGTQVAEDERFAHWDRIMLRATDKKGRSVWPHMWPTDDEEKERLGLHPSTKTLVQIEKQIGPAAFAAEMMGNPGGAAAQYFPFDRTSKESEGRFGYRFEGGDGRDPAVSNAEIVWNRYGRDGVTERRMRLRDVVAQCKPFAVLDTSYSASSHSDYKVVHVFATTPDRELLSLDVWAGQADESVLIRNALELSAKWGVRILWPEYVSRQKGLFHTLEAVIRDKLYEWSGVTMPPRVMPLKIGFESKVSKVAATRLWFDHALIKVPWVRLREPAYRMLADQIEQFNPEVADGGLQNDDMIDTVAMAAMVLRQRVVVESAEAAREPGDPMTLLREGRSDVDGLSVASSLQFDRLTVTDVLEIHDAIEKRKRAAYL